MIVFLSLPILVTVIAMDLSVVCITEADSPRVLKAYVKMSLSSTLKESVLVLSGEVLLIFLRIQ